MLAKISPVEIGDTTATLEEPRRYASYNAGLPEVCE